MLDNSVAGGIPGGTTAFDSLVKEATEEASLDPELVRKRARAVGAVTYYFQTKAGWLQPEVQYVYDMRLEPGEARLAPMDGEVESFEVRLLFFPLFDFFDRGCGGVYSLCCLMRSSHVCTRESSSRIVRLVRCSPCCLLACRHDI
jgi:hypothetical protein